MRLSFVLMALVALGPLGARAQGFKGLDLTEEPKKDEKREEKAPEPLAPLVVTPRLSEMEIANEDRVKSVQRKAFLKRARLELTPMGFLTLNDAFYPKTGAAARLAYFFSDSFGAALRYTNYNTVTSDNVRLAKRQLQALLPAVQPRNALALDLLWSPIYGKVAIYNTIHTFDLYIVAGGGAVWSQTSVDSAGGGPGEGPHASTHLGIGQRFSLFDFLAVDLSLLETVYSDRPTQTKSVLQHMLSLNLGLSVFLPLGFEYKEP